MAHTEHEDLTDFSLKLVKNARNDLSNRSHEWLQSVLQAWCNRLQRDAFIVNVDMTPLGLQNLPAQPPSVLNRNNWRQLRDRLENQEENE